MTNEEKAKIILEDIEKKENAIKKARAISMFIDKEEAK